MNYRIVVDSSANRLTDGHLISVPLKIVTDERQYVDDETLPLDEMLEYLSNYKGKSGTSCPNTAEYVEAFVNTEIELVDLSCAFVTQGGPGCIAIQVIEK